MTGQVHSEHHRTVRFPGNYLCCFLAFLQLRYVCVLTEAVEGTSKSGRMMVSSKTSFGQASPGLDRLYSKLGVRDAVADEETRGADDDYSDRERQALDDLGREGRRLEDDYDWNEQEATNVDRRSFDGGDEGERRLPSDEHRTRPARDMQALRYGEEVDAGGFQREPNRVPAERERWHGRHTRKPRQTDDAEFDRFRRAGQYEVADEGSSLDEVKEEMDDHFRGRRHEEESDSDLVDPDAYVTDRRDRHRSDTDLVDPDTYVADRRDRLGSDDNDDEERRAQQRRFAPSAIEVTTTRDPFKFAHGDKVRAFHEGERKLMDAIVKSINEDGTITVTWSSGDTTHRTMRSDSVFRPQNPDPQDAYRLDGPNAFDIEKERKNIAAGIAMGPSKRTPKADIYDGETLFPPSMLTEEMRSRSRAKHRPSPGHSAMLRSEMVDE